MSYPPAFAVITGWFTAGRLGALATLTLVARLASALLLTSGIHARQSGSRLGGAYRSPCALE